LAFLRFSRDKRGYENFYLVETSTNRRGKTRARVLYWFRTPPGVKVGREPFDADIRRALEAQNPNVVFDWRKISETPIPSADAERWRERRRLDRAERARQRGAAGEGDEAPGTDTPTEEVEGPDELADGLSATGDASDDVAPEDLTDVSGIVDPRDEPITSGAEAPSTTSAPASDSSTMGAPGEISRRKRRRRRGRHRRADVPGGAAMTPSPTTRAQTESKESSEVTSEGETGDSDDPNEV
jgi:hypothetical protein